MLCNAVRVGGALSTTVDGAATVGLSTTIIESSGATSLNIADIQLQSTGRLDSSIAEDASFGMQGVQVSREGEYVVGQLDGPVYHYSSTG